MFKLQAIALLQFWLQLLGQNSGSKPLDSKRTPKAKLRILVKRAPSVRISIGQCAKPFLIKRSVNPLDLLYKLVNLHRILPLGKYLILWMIISPFGNGGQCCCAKVSDCFEICFEMMRSIISWKGDFVCRVSVLTIAYVTSSSVCYSYYLVLIDRVASLG